MMPSVLTYCEAYTGLLTCATLEGGSVVAAHDQVVPESPTVSVVRVSECVDRLLTRRQECVNPEQ